MKYTLKNHKKENDRLLLTIEQSQFFGLIKEQITVVDSCKVYLYNNQSVWYILPKYKRIDAGSKLYQFCIDCKNEIILKFK